MARTSHSPQTDNTGAGADTPVDRLPIYLRGYAAIPPRPKKRKKGENLGPGDWVLIFDTETTTNAAQRLRIGTYQLLKRGELRQQGIFFDPDAVTEEEVDTLRREAARLGHRLLQIETFIETIVFGAIVSTGGTIVGINLPFDLSRLARDWDTARTVTDSAGNQNLFWKGGFTFRLSRFESSPRLRIKHVSRRFSFFGFTAIWPGTARSERNKGRENAPEQAYCLDLGTLAAALTGKTHSLKGLAKHLETPHQKSEGGDFDRPIDRELIEYAINDVQVTKECYDALLGRYQAHAHTGRPPHAIYTEATLGKAYLESMGIRPWQRVRSGFSRKVMGAIMSAYFGGRAEVHCRREVVRTLYCDFASMYPTVCTLMDLWRFVIAKGVKRSDATAWTRDFLDRVEPDTLQDPATWQDLTVLVKVEPEADIFPVRARYGEEPVATIGVNYLTSEKLLWFTLADCVASKLLTGKPPRIRNAIRFTPREPQQGLRAVALAGDTSNQVNPLTDDFYHRVIDLRRQVRKRQKAEQNEAEAKRLDAQQLALKILANATSYGIFIEVNVEDLDEAELVALYEAERSRNVETKKREAPGRFFHPLLATLITGAARLMLAITERKLLDAGLDWAFCDTDSMAFAKPEDMVDHMFEQKVRSICAWFAPLDPFTLKGDVLKIEEQNFAPGTKQLKPLYCYAISAKRYALFNKGPNGEIIIRKASGHGLGHLLAPYGDPDQAETSTGVPPWQEDFWREIVKATLSGNPDGVRLDWHPAMEAPAASRYTATTPALLRSFSHYNSVRKPPEQVRPFTFMLWFHAKEPHEVAVENPKIDWTKRMRKPKPAAPYDRNPAKAAPKAFDRVTGEAVNREWLETYDRLLRTYARHPETKFLGGAHRQSGPLRRRHVVAETITFIGKEADRWEEDELYGADEDSVIEYALSAEARGQAAEVLRGALEACTHLELARAARVSKHTVRRALDGDPSVGNQALGRLVQAVGQLSAKRAAVAAKQVELLQWADEQARKEGRSGFAARIGYDPANLKKVLSGARKGSRKLLGKLERFRRSCP